MEDLAFALRIVIGIMILVPAAIWIRVYFLLRRAAKTKVRRVEEGEAAADIQTVLSGGVVRPEWLRENGFHPAGVYSLTVRRQTFKLVVWTKRDEETSFQAYIFRKGRIEKEFGTDLGDHSLCTCSTELAQIFPMPPGKWVQSFAETEVADLWIRHTSALDYIARQTGLRPDTGDPPTAEGFEKSINARYQYLFSLPLWPLRIPYWILTRARLRHNKPIWELPEEVRL